MVLRDTSRLPSRGETCGMTAYSCCSKRFDTKTLKSIFVENARKTKISRPATLMSVRSARSNRRFWTTCRRWKFCYETLPKTLFGIESGNLEFRKPELSSVLPSTTSLVSTRTEGLDPLGFDEP